jgi:hypothetical protein
MENKYNAHSDIGSKVRGNGTRNREIKYDNKAVKRKKEVYWPF